MLQLLCMACNTYATPMLQRSTPGKAADGTLCLHTLPPRGGLFAVGSKFTHTCGQPNSVFKSCGGLG